MKIHLDTDFGGDPDDACALVMLLGTVGVEITGITTNLDEGGRRAGCVKHYLEMLGRSDIPVAAGAARSMTTLETYESTWGDRRYWPDGVPAAPSPAGAATELLTAGIAAGATIVAIGAHTNLAVAEMAERGSLSRVPIVAMGGFLGEMPDDFPPWEADRDFNVQCDTRAAEVVARAEDLTLSTITGTARAQLRQRDLDRLRSAGPAGELLARQSLAYAEDEDRSSMHDDHPGIAPDFVNFHWDPVACAVATGWAGATVVEHSLRTVRRDDLLVFEDQPLGPGTKVVEDIDADAFTEHWLSCVEAAHH